MKVAIVTCYKDPDYVRARTLRSGFNQISGVKLMVLKNSHKSFLRYPEVMIGLIKLRRRIHPDVYVLTFRGQEMLPFVLLVAWGKPVIFDEMVVPLAWAKDENHQPSFKKWVMMQLSKTLAYFYSLWLNRCRFILSDTQAHAEVSARLSGVNLSSYKVVPVGTDETLFEPSKLKENKHEKELFVVFIYASMLPLHGLDFIIGAAEILKADKSIHFSMVGGGKLAQSAIETAKLDGANVDYRSWVPFEDLPTNIKEADICLGGPFGGTPQANRVITGKTFQFLACGVPTVVGQTDQETFFVDKKNCLIAPQADAKGLAEKILWAYKHPQELVNIGQAGLALYSKNFSSRVIAADLKSLLAEL